MKPKESKKCIRCHIPKYLHEFPAAESVGNGEICKVCLGDMRPPCKGVDLITYKKVCNMVASGYTERQIRKEFSLTQIGYDESMVVYKRYLAQKK